MRKFLRFFIGKPVAVLLAALLIVCLGIFCACISDEVSKSTPCTLRITVKNEAGLENSICEKGEAALAGLKDCRMAAYTLKDDAVVFTAIFEGESEQEFYLTAVLNKLSSIGLPREADISAVSADKEFIQFALTGGERENRNRSSQNLANELTRISGVYSADLNYGYLNGKEADIISVRAERGVTYTQLSEKIKNKVAAAASDNGLAYALIYDYAELIGGSRGNAALFLLLGALLCLLGLFLLLRTLPAITAAAGALLLCVAGGLLLCPLPSVGFSPLSCAGVLTGAVTACLCVGFTLHGTKKRPERENSYLAAEMGAYHAVKPALIITATAVCALLPLVFIGSGAAAFALPALLSVILALPAALITAPCLFCLIRGGKKYYLAGNPLKKEVDSDILRESVKDFTAQPLTEADEARKMAAADCGTKRTIEDFVIPSLSDISKLSRKAKRAVRRRRMTADKPSRQLKKGYSFALNGALKKRGAVIVACLIAAAAFIALGFVSGAQLAPALPCSILDVEIVPVSKVVSEKETRQFALNSAALLKDKLSGVQSVSLSFKEREGKATAVIQVRLKSAYRAEKAAKAARSLIDGGTVWNTFAETRDGSRYTFGLSSSVSVYVYTLDAADSDAVYQRLNDELSKVKGFVRLKSESDFEGARADGKYISLLSAVFDDTDFNTAVSSLNAKTAAVLSDFSGSFYRTGGAQRQMTAALGQILIALIISLLLLYILSASITGSLIKPLAAMAALPLTIGGGFIALAIGGLPLSAPALLGLIAACSVTFACALGILLKTEHAVKEGVQPAAAVIKSAAAHLKYAVYGMLLSLCALLPLSLISPLVKGLGAAALGGIIIGTAALMFTVPAGYLLIKRTVIDCAADEAPVYDMSESDVEIEIGDNFFKSGYRDGYENRPVPQSPLSREEARNGYNAANDFNGTADKENPYGSDSVEVGGAKQASAAVDEACGDNSDGNTRNTVTEVDGPVSNPPASPSVLPPPPDKILL